MTESDGYVTDEATGKGWRMLLGDSCERLAELDDDSVDLCVYSPPFASLFTYSPSDRDLGNSSNRQEFLDHYSFIVAELLRVMKPGRIVAVHCQQVTLQKAKDGHMGLTDFRGELIRAHMDAGMIFHGEVTVDKDPQAQAIRTKAHALMFVSLKRDGCNVRPALADYVLLFRKPGDNAVPVDADVDNETWIEWARPIWTGIRESATLNAAAGRDNEDERHICPLQLPLIERCVRLWTNKGETVLSPFGGIGSEGYEAIRHHRRYIGIELKPSYWAAAVRNLEEAERQRDEATLFDALDEDMPA
jgi:DNA modification methylase